MADGGNTALAYPTGDGQGEAQLSLATVQYAERRLEDIAVLTREKAPELLSTILRAWKKAADLLSSVTKERLKAEKTLADERATVLLDRLPRVMQEKGIEKSNKEIRDAVLSLDPEVSRLTDRLREIEALEAWLKIRVGLFDRAHSSIKRLLDTPGALGGEGSYGDAPTGARATNEYPRTGTRCAARDAGGVVCGLPQYQTPAGEVCMNGHGGAPVMDEV